ncbi:MAG: shikimate dehydrogenase [Terriglobales bacterium]
MKENAAKSHLPRLLPLRLPRLCIAVPGADATEMLERAEALCRTEPFFEFRLDYLKQPAAALPKFKRFIDLHSDCVLIATCRRAVNGGRFRGSVAAQVEVLLKTAAAGFQIIDLEIESAEALKPAELAKIRSRAALMISFHDFKATRKLDETFARMQAIAADHYKLATTATSLYDNVVMMKLLEQKSHTHNVVGLCMGELGIISRVLALRAGSLFTFAAAVPGEETAPGQMTVRTLRDVFRIEQVDAATRVYGVAGNPVSQSLSPVMMNAAFRRENLNCIYLPLQAKHIQDLLKCVQDIPISGFSVTMPYKEEIVPHLHNSDPWTQKTGACNTVVRAQDGRLYGFNTDVAGVVVPLEQRLALNGAKVLVIGAGGAARAAVFGIRERGADVYIINRSPATGQKLARQARVKYLKRADLKKHKFDVIINATPVGMDSKQSPLSEKEIQARYVFDMVYTAKETPFAKAARAAGAQIIPGTEMFVYQGARQFEIWTGKPAPALEMLNVVNAALAMREAANNANGRNQR